MFFPILAVLAVQTPAPSITANFNERPGGALRSGVLTIRLEAAPGVWHPEAEDGMGLRVEAFREVGGPLTNPGPMIRVRAGTTIAATVRNAIPAETLVVHGLTTRPGNDSLVLLPGESKDVRFVAGAPGTYFYWGSTTRKSVDDRKRRDSQLSGAFIVDPPGRLVQDRVFVIGVWIDSVDIGSKREKREVPVINGKMYPYLPELTYTVGDSVHWRWINASDRIHPMHLHGFYYRVDATGTADRDSIYAPERRRFIVTEALQSGSTMATTWVPERAGNWLFHCHILFHVAPDLTLRPAPPTTDRAFYEGMSGLVLGLHVRPAPGPTIRPAVATATREPRQLRLLIQKGKHSFPGSDSTAFGFVLQQGGAAPAPDSVVVPGAPLVLTRGEPVAITVVNHLAEPAAVHWHGIELESYYDGVPGMSGMPGHTAPSIAAGDSFVVRFTPPRAGTFIYHTHIDDLRHVEGGLYGAIIVLEPGQKYDPSTDHVLLISTYNDDEAILWNGQAVADTLHLPVGVPQRLRFVIIPAGGAGEIALLRDTTELAWTPLAKDGRDLLEEDRQVRPSAFFGAVGETYDFAFTAQRPDVLRFVIRDGGQIFYSAPVKVD